MKNKIGYSTLFVFALILSACASATPTPSASQPSGPATVDVSQNATLGSFLVASNGMTLYLYTTDTPNTSNCYGPCAMAWPPLLTRVPPLPARV